MQADRCDTVWGGALIFQDADRVEPVPPGKGRRTGWNRSLQGGDGPGGTGPSREGAAGWDRLGRSLALPIGIKLVSDYDQGLSC
jgi:hypothetical protein